MKFQLQKNIFRNYIYINYEINIMIQYKIYICHCDPHDMRTIVMKYEIMNLKSACDRNQCLILSKIRSINKIILKYVYFRVY